MDVSKLYVGQEIKNYKALCELLGAEVKNGNSKKAQLKELNRYLNYNKIGNKFIINELYKVPLPPDNNITKYIPLIEQLILHIIFENGSDKTLYINKSKLYRMLKMINDKYTNMKYHKMQLSKKYNIDIEVIKDFYNTSDDLLERNVQQALKSLEQQSLIKSNEVLSVCENKVTTYNTLHNLEVIDEFGDIKIEVESKVFNKVETIHRPATEDETKLILSLQHERLDILDCHTMRDVFSKGLKNDFYKPINDYLLHHHNISYYYNSYQMIFNKNHITKAYIDNKSLILDEESYIITSSLLNKNITHKLLDMASNRHDKARNLELLTLRELARSKDDYIDDIKSLVDKLIHNS